MLTNIQHVAVFLVLIIADVSENIYCIFSLYHRLRLSRKIVPIDEDCDDTNESKQSANTLTKRTSSVLKLIETLDEKRDEGTILFIAATLLQREFVEVIVPIQSFGVLTVLYHADVKSNSITSSWNGPEDYHSAMMYTGLDLGVELFVFVCTISILRLMFPELSSWRILSGLIRANFSAMILLMVACWMAMLCFQCLYWGMDPTFRFEWIQCADDENATWNGGFDWDC